MSLWFDFTSFLHQSLRAAVGLVAKGQSRWFAAMTNAPLKANDQTSWVPGNVHGSRNKPVAARPTATPSSGGRRKLMPRFERYASVQLLDGLLQSIAQPLTS